MRKLVQRRPVPPADRVTGRLCMGFVYGVWAFVVLAAVLAIVVALSSMAGL